ncbi:MAG: HAD family phosphatase [Chitinophagaceae bacterium]|nr:HAD family phosphatase [Chitinophagaceae bacterium]
MQIDTIVWDLGGVLIDWNPGYVFTDGYFGSAEKKKFFFENVCTHDWNENQDAGYPLSKATEELVAKFPEWESAIRDFYGRWEEMLGGQIESNVEIFRQLKQKGGVKFYALTNWSAELFPVARQRYYFLQWFDGILVSGEEKTRKPFPDFYELLFSRYSVNPAQALFIDDNLRNINAAKEFGLKTILYTTSEKLNADLAEIF